ncbi:helix-turn-helix domain-containing protein [Nocardia asteroides]|uniref:helix-turn-helix domain-containing protein n=1 Tax=Nocardia asteroides TaxID=1824 RepID=UPI001E5B822A|nr:helix-turn-helix transcriptional regulator [Nocardia asteroides]UGT64338.1 helix-turn-helix domain-containing protein [Nocardia asteroides]
MSPSPHAGQAIAAERKLAGLSQRQLATRANYSLAMVKAVEQGREPASPAFIAAAARVLRVEPERLTGTPYREVLAEDGPLEGIAELRAILCEGEYVRPEEPGTIADLQASMQRINDEDRKGNSRKALAKLPALIRKTYGALQETADPAAYELLCSAYNAADRMCRRFGFMSLTIPAIDRYDWAAARGNDPLAPAVGQVMRTRLLVYQDSTDLALTLVDKAIAESPGESEGALSVAGAAHLAGAVAAARGLRLDTAHDHLAEARAIGQRLGHESRAYETLFGPANTEIHAVGVELEAGDPGRAAREGSALKLPRSLAKTRAGHHWQDVSRAWLLTGKPDKALDALNQARRIAPQQTRLHPAVRETVHGIAAAQRRQTSSLTGFASWLGVQV